MKFLIQLTFSTMIYDKKFRIIYIVNNLQVISFMNYVALKSIGFENYMEID